MPAPKSTNSAISHFKEMLNVMGALDTKGIEMFEHSYLMHAFGSFTVVLGTAHHRARFSWDGREFFLDISHSMFGSSGDHAEWRQIDNKRLDNPAGIYEELTSQAQRIFAI